MKIENRWMRYFFGLEPAPAFVVMPAAVAIILVVVFTDKSEHQTLEIPCERLRTAHWEDGTSDA